MTQLGSPDHLVPPDEPTNKMIRLRYFGIGILLSSIDICLCHIALTFPAARYPPLDYLDSIGTNGPCGVPTLDGPSSTYTTLVAGESYNVTWKMNMKHQGGFKIYLLDSNGQPKRALTSPAGDFIRPKETSIQHYTINLPLDFTCQRCILQLEREAKDISDNSWFWSCADLTILAPSIRKLGPILAPSLNACFGHGRARTDGGCNCNRLYYGEFCQYKDDCETDKDCGTAAAGRCMDIQSRTAPKRVCYCEPGRYGRYCEKQFVPSEQDRAFDCFNYQYPRKLYRSYWHTQASLSPMPRQSILEDEQMIHDMFRPSCYWRHNITNEDTLYWRRVGTDMEMVLVTSGQSWSAIGWRPPGTTVECKQRFIQAQTNGHTRSHDSVSQNGAQTSTRSNVQVQLNRTNYQQHALYHRTLGTTPPTSTPGWPNQQMANGYYSSGDTTASPWYQWTTKNRSKRQANLGTSQDWNPFTNTVRVSLPPPIFSKSKLRQLWDTWNPNGVSGYNEQNPRVVRQDGEFWDWWRSLQSRLHLSTVTPAHLMDAKTPWWYSTTSYPTPSTNPTPAPTYHTTRSSLPKPMPPNINSVVQPRPINRPSAPVNQQQNGLHAMDCVDVVYGSAMASLSHIVDSYSHDRSTPLHDTLFGGNDSIKAAYALETPDGKTILMFRKPITANDLTDQSITAGKMHVIWARGQHQFTNRGDADFYKPKVLMYHGTNRKAIDIELIRN